MIRKRVLQFTTFFGLSLLAVIYIPPHNQHPISTPELPQKLGEAEIQVPQEKAFEAVKVLTDQQKYMGAVERLRAVEKAYPQYKKAKTIELQYQKKVLNSIGACPNGFDPDALPHSRFYKATDDKYIVQVRCYSGDYQPAYEYYLYDESRRSTKISPLNLTEFEKNQDLLLKKDTNFIAGNSEFNKTTKELVVSQKYGSSKDCGSLGTYKFDNDKFVLQQFMADFQCDDGKLQYQSIYPHRIGMKD
jgi:hypothetical protein